MTSRQQAERRVAEMAIDMFYGDDAAEALENARNTDPDELRQIFRTDRENMMIAIDDSLSMRDRNRGLDRMANEIERTAAFHRLDMLRAREGLEMQGEPLQPPPDEGSR